jgi:hypothetical protein
VAHSAAVSYTFSMFGYILLIALVNLGFGFALAAYWGRNRLPSAPEDPAPASPSSAEDAAAARASFQAHLASRRNPGDAGAESVTPEADDAAAEPAAAAAV